MNLKISKVKVLFICLAFIILLSVTVVLVMTLAFPSPEEQSVTDATGVTDAADVTGVAGVADDNSLVQSTDLRVKCSNSATDALTINSVISSSKEGDEIIIQGTCSINEVIKLLGNRSYRGESRTGTILKQADGANLDAVIASDSYLDNVAFTGYPVSVRQLTIDGNKSNNSEKTHGILLRSWQSMVSDVFVTNVKGSGIKLVNKSANGTMLTNTQVNGQIIGNFIENSDEHGVYVEDEGNSLTDWQLMDNWIANSGTDGIHLDNAAGWLVERNHIYGVQHHAIYADRLYGTSVSDNYIEGFGESVDVGTWYGIAATVQGDVGSVIANNRVFNLEHESNSGSTYRYIGITQVNYGTGVCSVTGNVIRGAETPRGVGVYYNGGSHTLNVVSLGNAIEDMHSAIEQGSNVTVTTGF